MDIVLPIFFFVFAFICLIFALYEERDTNNVDEDEKDKSDNLIIILMGSAVTLFFVSAACFLGISTSYYSATLDEMVTTHVVAYEPLAYVPLGFAILAIILTSYKGFQMLDRARNE